jgi:hypothetical protein
MDEIDSLREQLHEMQGSLLAMECFLNSMSQAMPPESRPLVGALFARETDAFRVALMHSTAPEATVNAFERDTQRAVLLLGEAPAHPGGAPFEDLADD